jgi:hypothetical protein
MGYEFGKKKGRKQNRAFFCASGERGYATYDDCIIDQDYLEHDYITFGYLGNDIATTSTTTHRQQLQSTASASSLASTTLPLLLRKGREGTRRGRR